MGNDVTPHNHLTGNSNTVDSNTRHSDNGDSIRKRKSKHASSQPKKSGNNQTILNQTILDQTTLKKTRVNWPRYYRLISSSFPPIDLFDDISDPEDWSLLCSAESKTNPRVNENIGNLDLVSPEHRIGGPGATYVMAPFTHISTDRPGRFHDGTYGAFYAANLFETAVLETAYHRGLFYGATDEPTGWITQLRELVGEIDNQLIDIRGHGFDQYHAPDSYVESQKFATNVRSEGALGVVYNSVRHPEGECFAAFYPNVMSIPVQGAHLAYHWNGERIDQVKELSGDGAVFRIQP
ncbi:MAG: RES domain-containing protein [Gammaproteobacteria bacterium]|nr:RES domain-containing protein [Gammaproteobacteria bacterium]